VCQTGIYHAPVVIAGMNHPFRVFRQHIPEPAGTTRRIEHLARIAGNTQGFSCYLVVAPIREAAPETILMFLEIMPCMLCVVLFRELQHYAVALFGRMTDLLLV